MRKGYNPNKDQALSKSKFWHQIIIPVYIPNLEGYFEDSLKILKKCLKSLCDTTHSSTFISVVNNGSCKEVTGFLENLNHGDEIHELINTSNIGKLNAINKGMIGHNFPFITIADADTLFLPGWQQETIKVFNNFPRAGTVGIVPQFNLFSNFCTNVIFDNLFNSKLHFRPVGQPEEMRKFYRSLDWDMKKDHLYLKSILSLEKNEIKACIGSGHFVATYRKEVFKEVEKYIPSKMGNNSEKILDKSSMNVGLWKLTTFNNYAYHMGNVHEAWIDNVSFEKTNNMRDLGNLYLDFSPPSSFSYFLKNKLFKKLLRINYFNRLFLRFKKLPKKELKKYPKIFY